MIKRARTFCELRPRRNAVELSFKLSQPLSDARIRCRLAGLRRGDEPLPVKSAFAGLALYRGKSVRGLRYDEGTRDCEHVSFHRALAERGGQLVLNPSLMLLAGRQGHHRTKST